mgnify:CR=1 FL=1
MSLTVARQNVQIRAVSRPIRLKARTATKGHHTEQKRERHREREEKEGKGRSEECRRGVMSYHVSLGASGNYTTSIYIIILSGVPDVAYGARVADCYGGEWRGGGRLADVWR